MEQPGLPTTWAAAKQEHCDALAVKAQKRASQQTWLTPSGLTYYCQGVAVFWQTQQRTASVTAVWNRPPADDSLPDKPGPTETPGHGWPAAPRGNTHRPRPPPRAAGRVIRWTGRSAHLIIICATH